jgi:hypothetical protein
MREATPSQLAFMETELERLIGIGVWEERRRSTWISPMFLVPKGDKWRLTIDLRHLNKFFKDFSVKYATWPNKTTSVFLWICRTGIMQ